MYYKHNRVLWDSKCGKNITRAAKDAIFNELANILGKIKNNCTVDDVKKKINALRSNYRRELRKVRRSEALAGANKDAVFQPTLWWFELMGFLEEIERPFDDVPSVYNMGNNIEDLKSEGCNKKRKYNNNNKNVPLTLASYDHNDMQTYDPTQVMQDFVNLRCEADNVEVTKQIFKEEREDTNQTPIAAECLQDLHVEENHINCSENSNGYHQNTNLLAINGIGSSTNLNRNYQTPHSTNTNIDDTFSYKMPEGNSREISLATGECDTFFYLAHLWANKLRHVEARQRLYAEKAINDIIFEAELGTLNRNSVKINET